MEPTKTSLIDYLLTSNNFNDNNQAIINTINHLNIAPTYPIVLVGGTNGKGSTCAYLTTILASAGYKVGTFTSPHVFDYNERIKLNNQLITDQELAKYLKIVIDDSQENLGIFKTFTLAAHLYFIDKKIDIAIIEVGIGGLKDTTNLFEPTISAITTVDLDHCDVLGDTIDAIGLEKAGIYRSNKPAFFGSKNIPTSVIDYAKQINADLTCYNKEYSVNMKEHSWDFISDELNLYSMPFPSLRGSEQIYNAALSIAILNKLKTITPVSSSQIKAGLLQTTLIGRFQVMAGIPQVILDTAHNPQAIELMCNNMLKLGFVRRNIAVFAIAKDKDYAKVIEIASKYFDTWYIAPLNTMRQTDSDELINRLLANKINPKNIFICDDIPQAFTNAYHQVKDEERIVAFGSFITVEQSYLTYIKIRK